MSIARCSECGEFVDTDLDDEFYDSEAGLCVRCREELLQDE